ncbi:MAG: carbamoyl-phosphate synthase domain-containing protein, partial [Clostridia bacterium]
MATVTKERMLVMENGSTHRGTGFGASCDALCELVFNTSMVGYQEIVTDPSYTAQTVVMTYPLIGNYGITDEDSETRTPTMGGLVVREYCDAPSNFRYTKTLGELLEENAIPGLEGVDTRRINRMIRSEGSQRALICDASTPVEEALERIRAYQLPTDVVSRVSCRKKWYARTPNPLYSVVAVDCGIKLNIIR